MAKKEVKKTVKKVETPEIETIAENNISVEPEVIEVEKKIQKEVETKVADEISEITEQMEKLQPADEVIETIMNSEPEEVKDVIAAELKKVDDLEKVVEKKMDEIIAKNPEVAAAVKKANPRFTNFWNGIEY